MSTASVRKNLSEQLLKFASKEENQLIRSALNKRPQIVFLEDLKWLDETILEMMARDHMPKRRFRRYNTEKNLKKARAIAKIKHDNFVRLNKMPGSKLNHIMETHVGQIIALDHPKVMEMIEKGEAYVVGSFSTAGELKKEIVAALVTRKSQKDFADSIAARADRGHGAGTGTPVSGLSVAQGSQAIAETLTPEQQKQFNDYILKEANNLFESGDITGAEASMIESVVVEYETIITSSGKLTAEYIPYITFQDKYTNRKVDAPRERFVKDTVFKFFKEFIDTELVNMEGSDSIKTLAAKQILDPLQELAAKNKNVKVKTSAKTKGRKKPGKGKASTNKQTSKRSGIVRNKRAKGKPIKAPRAAKTPTSRPLLLLTELNKHLPDRVRKNMQAPGLVNRTGRFAESVKVTDIVETPQGFPSIGYTYQKNPYEVFEMGSGDQRWATPERDPRILIDRSIREIATEFALGRFYTRRT